MIETYVPSGRFRTVATFLAVIISALLTVGAAYVYHMLLDWIKFIYISFLLTAGFAFAVGMTAIIAIHIGHVRNAIVGVGIGLVLFGLGMGTKYWFQYVSFKQTECDALIEMQEDMTKDEEAEFRKAFNDTISFATHIQIRVDRGWELGGGMPIRGFFVYLIWAIEAGVVLALTGAMAKMQAGEPYSEVVQQWADEKDVVMSLPVTSDEMVEQIQNATSVDDLLTLPIPKTDETNRVAVYTVQSIKEHALENAYLSVSLVTTTIDNKGNEQKKEDKLVKFAILKPEQRDLLSENAELMTEAITAYRNAKLNPPATTGDGQIDGQSEA